jgi:hypothetical protein
MSFVYKVGRFKVTQVLVIAEGVNVRGIIKLKLENSEGF